MKNLYKLFKRPTNNSNKGFTLIELLVVAAIIGILLALAIPNLIKARMSANEANARKQMQTLRDAEAEYFEMDLNNNNRRDFTQLIGSQGTADSLRDPDGQGDESDALVDKSFEGAVVDDGNFSTGSTTAICDDPKAGYCIAVAQQAEIGSTDFDFGWEASFRVFDKTGRRDFSVFGDATIRCTINTAMAKGQVGGFDSARIDAGCN